MNTQFIYLLAEAAHQEEVLEYYLESEDHEVTSPRESSKTTKAAIVEPEVEEEEFVLFDWPPPRAAPLKKNPKKTRFDSSFTRNSKSNFLSSASLPRFPHEPRIDSFHPSTNLGW